MQQHQPRRLATAYATHLVAPGDDFVPDSDVEVFQERRDCISRSKWVVPSAREYSAQDVPVRQPRLPVLSGEGFDVSYSTILRNTNPSESF